MSVEAKAKHFLKSSETWIAFIVLVLGALLTTGVVGDGGTVAKIIGGILDVAGFLGYTATRASLKNTATKAAAVTTGDVSGP